MNVVVRSDWITFYQNQRGWIVEHRSCPSGTVQPYVVKGKEILGDYKAAHAAAKILATNKGAHNVGDRNAIVIDQNSQGKFSVLEIKVNGAKVVLEDSCCHIARARWSAVFYASEKNCNLPFVKPIITKRAAPAQE